MLVQQIYGVLLLCRRSPWQSETCADQLEDILGFQPISTNVSRNSPDGLGSLISNLDRNVHT